MNKPEIIIAGRKVGGYNPPVLWPDMDVYFKRDENLALQIIDGISAAGCDFLKAAVLHRESLCLAGGHLVRYFDSVAKEMRSEPYRSVLARHVVPLDMMRRLLDYACQLGLELILSVYDKQGLDFAIAIGTAAVKIPSSNITHKSLIIAAASSGLPLVIDTGRSTYTEIARAMQWAVDGGASGRVMLQHSPPGPPATPHGFHMRMIDSLGVEFACPVGLSDHHSGLDMLPIAVALGACIYEKGVVPDSISPDIDSSHALPLSRVAQAVELLNTSWLALGERMRPDDEVTNNRVDRMGCISARDMNPGEMLTHADVDFAFPAVGIGAELIDSILGAKVVRPITKGSPVTTADIDSLDG